MSERWPNPPRDLASQHQLIAEIALGIEETELASTRESALKHVLACDMRGWACTGAKEVLRTVGLLNLPLPEIMARIGEFAFDLDELDTAYKAVMGKK